MSGGGLVDDYLTQLLGAAAAGTMGGEASPAPAPVPVEGEAPPPAPQVAALPPEPEAPPARVPEPPAAQIASEPSRAAPTPEPSAAPPEPVAAAPRPAPVVAPEPAVTASANPDEISEDEFEALLDALHGHSAPGTKAPEPAAAPAPAPAKPPTAPDEISEDEFEALLDALHGGAPPGASTPAPAAAAKAPKGTPSPGGDEITEDEFEALLDTLHGAKAPGASLPSTSPAFAAAAAVAVAAAAASASDEGDDEAGVEGWRGQERRASRRSSRWLRLRVHGQDYAVELLKVQEVLLPVGVLAMRDTTPSILGVMSLRGVVVPVLDLGLWLGLEEVEDCAQTRYVVLEQNGECLALKVSAVLDVHAIADAQVEPAENTLASPETAMLRGVTRLNSQPVILLDAVGLLG
jgi:purine-binding chemotaxis protein CheW